MTTEKSTTQKLATYRTASQKQHNGLSAQTGTRAGEQTNGGKDWTQIFEDQIKYSGDQSSWSRVA